MALTEIYAADLGGDPYIANKRNATGFFRRNLIATFNTPSESFNTIIMPKLIGGLAGDTVKLTIFKGSIPDDLGTTDDDEEATRKLDINDLLGEATYNVGSNTPDEGVVAQFNFDVDFNLANCGATYTAIMQQFDSSDAPVSPSQVFCTDRDGVHNFINDVDWGYEGDGTSTSPSEGGAGNTYTMVIPPSGQTIYDGTVQIAPFAADHVDPCPAWGIYSRPLFEILDTLNSDSEFNSIFSTNGNTGFDVTDNANSDAAFVAIFKD